MRTFPTEGERPVNRSPIFGKEKPVSDSNRKSREEELRRAVEDKEPTEHFIGSGPRKRFLTKGEVREIEQHQKLVEQKLRNP